MAVDDLWFSTKRDAAGRRIPTRRNGRGKRWRVRFTDDTGRKVERLFERKPDAEQFDASARADVARGQYVDLRAGQETVESYGARWLAGQLYRPATADRVTRTLKLHVYPVLGRLALAQVRASQVQAWVKNLDLAPSSARVAYSVLVTLFAAAVRDRLVAINPCAGITLPAVEADGADILTPEQVRGAAERMPARLRAAVWLGAGCGLRVSEVLGLEIANINFLGRELHVVQQLATEASTETQKSRPYLCPPKSRTSRRTVELPSVVADALARHIELYPPSELDVMDRTTPRNERTRLATLLFTTESGQPVTRSVFGHAWHATRGVGGLPTGTGFHALRHHYASLLIAGGASVKTVQTALGHSTPMVTLNTYVGLWPDQTDRPRNLVDAAFAGAPRAVASS